MSAFCATSAGLATWKGIISKDATPLSPKIIRIEDIHSHHKPMSQPDLFEWLAFLPERHRAWFSSVFNILCEQEWSLDPCHPSDGHALHWNLQDSRVVASRTVSLPVQGTYPGVELSDDLHDWEITIASGTPLDLVRRALLTLKPE